jgi:E3 ubiquitin-protein ligase HERC2
MTVRCCRTYEEVHEGDLGRVTKLDRDGLHDLNVQVAWGARSAGAAGTYWVRYIHVELLSQPPGAVSSGGSGNLSPIKAVLWIRIRPFRWGFRILREFFCLIYITFVFPSCKLC